MSAALDAYALPRLPSTAARGPTRACACVLLLLLCAAALAVVPVAESLLSRGGGAAVATLTAAGPRLRTAPLALPDAPEAPEAALRFERAAAAAGAGSADDDDPRASGAALGAHWVAAFRAADDAQARLLADAVRTLGWLVARTRAPR